MEKETKKTMGTKKPGASYSADENNSMLRELLIEQLRDIYWAEKHLVKSLPKMEKAASSEDLAAAFSDHLAVTQDQVSRLEK